MRKIEFFNTIDVDRTFVGALPIGGRTSCACISNARPRARAQAAGRFRGYDDVRVEFAAPSPTRVVLGERGVDLVG